MKATLLKRYKGSYLGVFCTLLNPLTTMLGLALVLPLIIKFHMDHYFVYLFSGMRARLAFTTASFLDTGILMLSRDSKLDQRIANSALHV